MGESVHHLPVEAFDPDQPDFSMFGGCDIVPARSKKGKSIQDFVKEFVTKVNDESLFVVSEDIITAFTEWRQSDRNDIMQLTERDAALIDLPKTMPRADWRSTHYLNTTGTDYYNDVYVNHKLHWDINKYEKAQPHVRIVTTEEQIEDLTARVEQLEKQVKILTAKGEAVPQLELKHFFADMVPGWLTNRLIRFRWW